jgi:transcriptional regulator NrdR family protein
LNNSNQLEIANESYRAIVQFVDNAGGPIANQLRGKMERCECNGNMEWVSIEGKEAWYAKQRGLSALPNEKNSSVSSLSARSTMTHTAVPATGSQPATSSKAMSMNPESSERTDLWTWLENALGGARAQPENLQQCYSCFHRFCIFSVQDLFAIPPQKFTREELSKMGIEREGLISAILNKYQSEKGSSTAAQTPTESIDPNLFQELQREVKQLKAQVVSHKGDPISTTDVDVNVDAGGGLVLAQKKSAAQNTQNASGDQDLSSLINRQNNTEVTVAQMGQTLNYVLEHLRQTHGSEIDAQRVTQDDQELNDNKSKLFSKN